MVEATNLMAANLTCQYRDQGNTARALLRDESDARMTCNLIAGEFREFKEEFNSLAERGAPAAAKV
jgi:hypothetical protein